MTEQTVAMYCPIDHFLRLTRPQPPHKRRLADAGLLTTTALLAARFFGGNRGEVYRGYPASKRPHKPWQSFTIQHFRQEIKTTISHITERFSKSIHAVTAQGFALERLLFVFTHTLAQPGARTATWVK